MIEAWNNFNNMSNKTEFETELNKLLQDIVSEGMAKIDTLTDEEIREAMDCE